MNDFNKIDLLTQAKPMTREMEKDQTGQSLVSPLVLLDEAKKVFELQAGLGWEGWEASARTLELLNQWAKGPARQSPASGAAPPIQGKQPVSSGRESLGSVFREVAGCKRCELSQSRKNLVFGQGNPHAEVMFVGEGPGAEEDAQGLPFVGPAGKLLTSIIQNGMGLPRQEVFIANIVKCRPPGNRDPQPDEVAACLPFLEAQIRCVRPKVIVALGRVASQVLLNTATSITRLRGNVGRFCGIPVMPTYHPSYLLRAKGPRERELKGEVWQDIQKVMAMLGLEAKK